jgi:hypothetical protein
LSAAIGSSVNVGLVCEVSDALTPAACLFAVVGVKSTASNGDETWSAVSPSSLPRSPCSDGVLAIVAYDSHPPGRWGRNSFTGLLGLLGLPLVGDAALELSLLFSHDCTLFLEFLDMLDCVEPRRECETSPNLPANACTRPLLGDSERSRGMASCIGDCA